MAPSGRTWWPRWRIGRRCRSPPAAWPFSPATAIPAGRGQLFIGSLRAEALIRIALDGHKVLQQERLLQTLNERIRDVRQGPDGYLYLLTDNPDGRVLRLLP